MIGSAPFWTARPTFALRLITVPPIGARKTTLRASAHADERGVGLDALDFSLYLLQSRLGGDLFPLDADALLQHPVLAIERGP